MNYKEIGNDVERMVDREYESANEKFPLFASDHEAFAVILEEMIETTKELVKTWLTLGKICSAVMGNYSEERIERMYNRMRGQAENTIKESTQVAAMCKKAIESKR